MLATTAVALVQDAAQLAGSATRDRSDHFAVPERDRVAELLPDKPVRAAAGSPQPKASSLLAATEELLDRLACIDFGRVGQMQIDHRGLQAAVTQVLLDDSQADTRFQQMGGVGMSQRVDRNFLAEVDLAW